MKKIIAISVMFALIAGAVFADTSIGGGFNVHFDLAASAKGVADYVGMGNYGGGGSIDVNWEGENAGGKIRFFGENSFVTIGKHALGWWKPIDQLKIQLGAWDGDWGHSSIVGWGFTAGAKDVAALDTGFAGDSGSGFWGGFNNGLSVSIYPADGFEIDIGIPLVTINKNQNVYYKLDKIDHTGGDNPVYEKDDKGNDKEYFDQTIAPLAIILQNTKLNVSASIPDVGTVKLALGLSKKGKDADQIGLVGGAPDGDLSTEIGFAFYLSAIENMGAELGVLVGDKAKKIDLSIGYKVDAGDFGIKVGLRTGFGDAFKVGTKTITPFSLQILPYYNLGSLTAFLNAGFETSFGGTTTTVVYALNPYIQLPISGGDFWAGFKLKSSTASGAKAEWSIPVGFTFGF